MGHYSMKKFMHDAGKVTKPIHKDIASIVQGANKDLNKVIDTQAGIANNMINKSASTLSSLSMPLIVVGGAIAVYLITIK